jgi:hypothetical protein
LEEYYDVKEEDERKNEETWEYIFEKLKMVPLLYKYL